jgi:hypothetical protein
MRPHINIGTIGHVDHGKTTLTAAITATLSEQHRSEPVIVHPDPEHKTRGITINTNHMEYYPDPAPRSNSALKLMAMTAMLAGGFGLRGYNPSGADIRHDPKRPKTPKDMERMYAAQKKRDRKAAKRNSQMNVQALAPLGRR